MPKLTDEMRGDLSGLRARLQNDLNEAQSITIAFDGDDSRGDDFQSDVEMKIEEAIQGIEDLLEEEETDAS